MSVRKSERSVPDTLMELQKMAYDLAGYTMQAASNEKVIPKRFRWCIGEYLVKYAMGICENIDLANTLRNDNPATASERLKRQRLSKGYSFALLTVINTAFFAHKFHEEKLFTWVEKIVEVQKKLDNWIKSDAEALRKSTSA